MRFKFLSLLTKPTHIKHTTWQSTTLPLDGIKKLYHVAIMGMLVVGSGSMAQAASQSEATPNTDKTIAVTQPLQTTKEEIAVIQVLSEVCPPLLTQQQNQKFRFGYNAYLASMLPDFDQPAVVLQYLADQTDYRKILAETRQQTALFSSEDNRAVCIELANYK